MSLPDVSQMRAGGPVYVKLTPSQMLLVELGGSPYELALQGDWFALCLVAESGERWSLLAADLMRFDPHLLVKGWPEEWTADDIEVQSWRETVPA